MKRKQVSYTYIFAFSGSPVPRLIERIHTAVDAGHDVAVAYLKRPGAAVKIGEIKGADLIPIDVPFRASGIDRLLAFPRLAYTLKHTLLKFTKRDAFVYVDSLDILAAICLLPGNRHFSIRYEVRDLHKHQLSSGLVGGIIRLTDRLLMPRIDHLIVTSTAYFERYYNKIYFGEVTLLENIPDPEVWKGFQAKRMELDDPIIVGLVGAIRYIDCVFALIEGARIARQRGLDVRLKIIGPDMEGRLVIDPKDDWILRSGPFDYVSEIKSIYSDLDVIWSVYDTRIENVRLALSNKLYESLLSGIPVVAAKNTHLSERVNELGIGTAVEDRSAESIANSLSSIKTGNWHRDACEKLNSTEIQTRDMVDKHRAAEQKAMFS